LTVDDLNRRAVELRENLLQVSEAAPARWTIPSERTHPRRDLARSSP